MRRVGVCGAAALSFFGSAARGQEAPQAPVEIYVYGAPAPDASYKARRQVTGTRSTRDPAQVAQPVSVISRTLLEDMQARRTDEALLLVPSVAQGSGFGSVWDDYMVRGFRVWAGSMYRDGYLMGYSGIGASDTVNVERVEVLRGSTAALYGPGLPGGTINVVTKQPRFTPSQELSLGFGSFDSRRASVDLTGPLASRRAAFRLTGSLDDSDGFRDFNASRRILLNPALLLKLGDARVLAEVQYFRMRYRPDALGVPVIGGDPFRLPVGRSYIEPHTPSTDFQGGLVHVEARQPLTAALDLRLGLQRQAGFLDESASYALGIDPEGRTLARLPTHFTSHSEDVAVQAGLEGRFSTGQLRHDFTLGADARYERVDWLLETADPEQSFAIDLFAPKYGQAFPALLDSPGPESRWTYALGGLYFSDRIRLVDALALALGARGDWYRQTSVAGPVDDTEGELSPSGRLGLLYSPLRAVAAYASVSRGFWPVVGVSATGGLLEPEHNLGAELGVRLAAATDALTLDLGVFRTDNENISVPDPGRPDFQVQRGAARSQGVEAEATARWGRALRAVASYAFNHARVTADPDPAQVGRRLPLAPEHSGAVWLQWLAADGWLNGLGAGAGALLVGDRALNDASEIPGYARLDAVLSYERGPARLALRIENLLGERYVRSGNDATSILFGAPRNAFLWLRLKT